MRNLAHNALPVLVVEDDADLREAIVDTLNLAGFSTLEARDGQSALACLKQELVGLVLSDAQMQPMDGYQLFAEIRLSHFSKSRCNSLILGLICLTYFEK